MYAYEWDAATGGYNLVNKITGLAKEVRPVFFEELTFLGLHKNFGWHFQFREEKFFVLRVTNATFGHGNFFADVKSFQRFIH